MKRGAVIVLLTVALIVIAAGPLRLLGEYLSDREDRNEDDTASPPFTNPPVDATLRLATHRFLPVGSSLSIADLGTILEIASVEPPSDVVTYSDTEGAITCNQGGTAFVRAQYRHADAPKNRVQTLLVVCVDEAGDCGPLPRASLDLERYLNRTPKGEADYLAQGRGSLWGLCVSQGKYRLDAPPAMPPLMFRIIDALADGVYSLSDNEFDLVRRSALTTYSGSRLSPPWISVASLELTQLSLRSDGGADFEANACDKTPACTDNASLARAGDLVTVQFSPPGNNTGLQAFVDAAGDPVVSAFVRSHLDLDWAATDHLPEPARRQIVYRLIGLELMDEALRKFDALYGLKHSGVHIGYSPYWETRYRVDTLCLTEQRTECRTLEDKVDAYERQRLAALDAEGFDLWFYADQGYRDDGTSEPLVGTAPGFDAFAGVVLSLSSGSPRVDDMSASMPAAVRQAAGEIGGLPIILVAHSSPMRFALDSAFCEAEVCTSAFSDHYATYEGAIDAMLDAFGPGQVRGFGVSLIDGGIHFDIREPYELRQGLWLNRVGETGYNNPLLNLYLAG